MTKYNELLGDKVDKFRREMLIEFQNASDLQDNMIMYSDIIIAVNNKSIKDMEYTDQKEDTNYTPVGMIQSFAPNRSRELITFGDFGCTGTVISQTKSKKSGSLSMLFHKKKCLLKALYQGSLVDVQEFKDSPIHIDVTKPMFRVPFNIMVYILGNKPDGTRSVSSKTLYQYCVCNNIGRTFQQGAYYTTDGAGISWARTQTIDLALSTGETEGTT